MENRSFDHYFGWLDARRRRASTQTLRRRRDRRAGRHPPRLDARGGVAGLRASRPRPRLGAAAAAQLRGRLPGRRQRQRRVRAHLLRRGRARVHPRRGASTRSTTASSARCSARPGRTATTSGRRSPAGARTTTRRSTPRGNQWETIFDRALGRTASRRPLLQLRPAVLGASGERAACRGRGRSREYYADCAARHAAEHHASSTRRSATAAAATASRPTSTRTATCASGQAWMADVVRAFVQSPELPARRAVRRLRRVGRVLRPRHARRACRDARASSEPRPGLRPDGLPDPGRGGLAVHAPAQRAAGPRATTRSSASSRSSS